MLRPLRSRRRLMNRVSQKRRLRVHLIETLEDRRVLAGQIAVPLGPSPLDSPDAAYGQDVDSLDSESGEELWVRKPQSTFTTELEFHSDVAERKSLVYQPSTLTEAISNPDDFVFEYETKRIPIIELGIVGDGDDVSINITDDSLFAILPHIVAAELVFQPSGAPGLRADTTIGVVGDSASARLHIGIENSPRSSFLNHTTADQDSDSGFSFRGEGEEGGSSGSTGSGSSWSWCPDTPNALCAPPPEEEGSSSPSFGNCSDSPNVICAPPEDDGDDNVPEWLKPYVGSRTNYGDDIRYPTPNMHYRAISVGTSGVVGSGVGKVQNSGNATGYLYAVDTSPLGPARNGEDPIHTFDVIAPEPLTSTDIGQTLRIVNSSEGFGGRAKRGEMWLFRVVDSPFTRVEVTGQLDIEVDTPTEPTPNSIPFSNVFDVLQPELGSSIYSVQDARLDFVDNVHEDSIALRRNRHGLNVEYDPGEIPLPGVYPAETRLKLIGRKDRSFFAGSIDIICATPARPNSNFCQGIFLKDPGVEEWRYDRYFQSTVFRSHSMWQSHAEYRKFESMLASLDLETSLGGWRSIGYADVPTNVMVGNTPTNNVPPDIISQPHELAPPGSPYAYDVQAIDPNGDALVYALTTAPVGMTIDGSTGVISWLPENNDLGNHSVVVSVSDPFGGTDSQSFVLAVRQNHSPIVVSQPPTSLRFGDSLSYDVRAIDPDGDAISFSLVRPLTGELKPSGSGSATLQWQPTADDIGTDVELLVRVEDSFGAKTQHRFFVYVFPAENNSPPSFTSIPEGTVTIPAGRMSVLGDTTSGGDDRIWVTLDANQSTSAVIDFGLGAAPPKIDVMLLLDDTASFQDANVELQHAFPELIEQLRSDPAFSGIDFGFGVSRFEDFTPSTQNANMPFVLNQPILDSNTPRLGEIISSALGRPAQGSGGDSVEDMLEGLFQLATGSGWDDPSTPVGEITTDNGYAGNLRAQLGVDGNDDVPRTQYSTGYYFDSSIRSAFQLISIADSPLLPLDRTVGISIDDTLGATVFRHETAVNDELLELEAPSIYLDEFVSVYAPTGAVIEPVETGGGVYKYRLEEAGRYSVVADRRIYDENEPYPSFHYEFDLTARLGGVLAGGYDTSAATDLEFDHWTSANTTLPAPTNVFRLSLEESSLVLMSFEDTANATWKLLDQDGNALRWGAASGEQLINATQRNTGSDQGLWPNDRYSQAGGGALPAGEYYLVFEPTLGGPASDFDFRLMLPSTTTNALSYGVSTGFVFTQSSDYGFGRLAGKAGEHVEFDVTMPGAGNYNLSLISPDGEVFHVEGYQASSDPVVRLPSDGVYLVIVRPVGGGFTSGTTDVLVQRAGADGRPAVFDRELAGKSIGSSLVTPFQTDRYFFETRAGEQYYFDGLDASGQVRVDYYDASGEQLFSLDNSEMNRMLPVSSFSETHTISLEPIDLIADVGGDRRGGGGFRPGALPIIITATDAGTRYAAEFDASGCVVETVTGLGGTSLPLRELVGNGFDNLDLNVPSCPTFDPVANKNYDLAWGSASVPYGAASFQETIDALNELGALVVGVGPAYWNPILNTGDVDDPNNNGSPDARVVSPRGTLAGIAELTGTVNATGSAIDSGITFQNQTDPILPGDPLFFDPGNIETEGNFVGGISDAIEGIKSLGFDVEVVIRDESGVASLSTASEFYIAPGGTAATTLNLVGDGGSHEFYVEFLRKGTEVVLGRIPVAINYAYSYDANALDPDGDVIKYSLVGETHGATINPRTGSIEWLPPEQPLSEYHFTVQASDGRGGTAKQVWTVEVVDPNGSNSAPIINDIEDQVATAGRPFELRASASDPDGDRLTYQLLASAGDSVPQGMTIDPNSGTIEWLPPTTAVGQTYPLTVAAKDIHGGEATENFALKVGSADNFRNRPPRILSNPPNFAITDQLFQYQIETVDPDGDPVRYSLNVAPNAAVIDRVSGTLSWFPTENEIGQHRFVVVASDGQGGSSHQEFFVRVATPNLPPVFTGEPVTVAEKEVFWSYDMGVVDPNGDTLAFELLSAPYGMQLFDNGWLEWTPTSTGVFPVRVRASDDRDGRTEKAFEIRVVEEILPPPTINSQPQGPAVIGELWDYELIALPYQSKPISFDLVSAPAGMLLQPDPSDATKANLSWVPAALEGNYEVKIWVGYAADSTQGIMHQFTLPVTLPNTPPIITSVPYDARVGQPWTYQFDARDSDGHELEYELLESQEGMTIANDGLITWTPNYVDYSLGRYAAFNAVRTDNPIVKVVARDGFGGQVTDEIFAIVQPPLYEGTPAGHIDRKAAFIRNNPTGPIFVDEPWVHNFVGIDPNGDSSNIIYRFKELRKEGTPLLQDFGSVNVTANGQVTILMPTTDSPELDAPKYDYVFEIEDEEGLIREYTMQMRFVVNNDWPEFTSNPVGPIQASSWQYDANAADPDSAGLTFSLAQNSVGSINGSTGNVTVSGLSQHSAVPLIVKVTDGSELADGSDILITQASTLIVGAAPDGVSPVFQSNPAVAVQVGDAYKYQLLTSDPNGDSVALALVSGPAGMSLSGSGLITWKPEQAGNHPVVVEATDGSHVSKQRFVVSSIDEYSLNEPPEVTSTPIPFAERDVPYSYQLETFDANDDTLEFALIGGPDWLNISAAGLLSGTPDKAGQQAVAVLVREVKSDDSDELSTIHEYSLTTLHNARPSLTSVPQGLQSYTIGQTTYNYDADATDPNAEDVPNLKFSLVNAPTGAEIDESTGVVSFSTTDYTLRGRHQFKLLVTDPAGATDETNVELQAIDPYQNSAPEFTSKVRKSLVAAWPYTLDLLATDADGDDIVFSIVSGPSEATLQAGGVLSYTPPLSAIGQNVVFVLNAKSARDNLSTNQTTTVSISGTPANAPPEIISDPIAAATADYSYEYAVLATDADDDALFWSVDKGPTSLTIDERTGLVQFTPTLADVGIHDVKISVADGYGGRAEQSFSLTIRASNLPPEVENRFSQYIPIGSFNHQILASDVEQNIPLLYQFVQNDGVPSGSLPWGLSVGLLTGAVTWNNTDAHATPRSGTLRVTDSRSGIAEQAFAFTTYDPAINTPPAFANSLPDYWVLNDHAQFDINGSDIDGDSLSYQLLNPPVGMTIDPVSGLISWIPTEGQLGLHSVAVSVSDGEFAAVQSKTIEVLVNGSPTVAAIDDRSLVGGQTLSLRATATDPDKNPLVFSATVNGGQPSADFVIDAASGEIAWETPTGSANHTVVVTATDPYGSQGNETFLVTTSADNQLPTGRISFSPNYIEKAGQVSLTVVADDDVAVDWPQVTLTGPGSSSIALDGSGRALLIYDAASNSPAWMNQLGNHTFTAVIPDTSGNTRTVTMAVRVVDNPPVVQIKSPTFNQEVYGLISVFGTIDDPQDQLSSYKVEIAPNSDPDFVTTIKDVPSGAREIHSGTIAEFDPTLLENGLYTITVTASDTGGNSRSQSVPISLEGNYKPGVLSLAFTDLSLPTADVPLGISRSYSSATADVSGDFGNGWTLELGIPEVEVSYQPNALQTRSGQPMMLRGTRVFVTLPDGTREGFTFDPIPERNNAIGLILTWLPYFRPDEGNTSFLDAKKHTLHAQNHGEFEEFVDFVTRESYHPATRTFGGYWKVLSQGGPEIHVDPTVENTGWIEDKNGNKTTIDPRGITHWSGRSIRISRDASGRITRVYDPINNYVQYSYNATGQLASVKDRLGEVTTLKYEDTDPDHLNYLTGIVDPIGRQQLTATFHASSSDNLNERSRLASLSDVNNVSTAFDFDIRQRSQGTTSGSATRSILVDRRGNPLQSVDPVGVTTRNRYDDDGNLIEQRQVVGSLDPGSTVDDLVSYYGYNNIGQPLSVTDAGGLTTNYSYNDLHLVASVASPGGQITKYDYDRQGNLTRATSPLGENTRLNYGYRGQLDKVTNDDGLVLVDQEYDFSGNLVATLDTDGNQSAFEYDDNGRQTARTTIPGGDDSFKVRQETVFDALDRVTGRTLKHLTLNSSGGYDTTIVWSTATVFDAKTGLITSETDQHSLETHYRYDTRGNQIESRRQVTPGNTNQWVTQRNVYDQNGRLSWSTDSYHSGQNGEPNQSSDIGSTHTIYDDAGRATTTQRWTGADISVDGNGPHELNSSRAGAAGSLVSSTATEYDSAGRVARSRNSNGLWTENFYDKSGNVIQTRSEAIDETGHVVHLVSRTVLDGLGRALFSSDSVIEAPGSATITVLGNRSSYDAQGRTVKTERLQGLQLTLVDRHGAAVQSYDVAEGPFAVRVDNQGIVMNQSESFYNADGQLVRSIGAAGTETRYEYDDRGRQIRQISEAVMTVDSPDPLRHITETEYDAQGRAFRTWSNIRGRDVGDRVVIDKRFAVVTTQTYDDQGRVTLTTQPDGSTNSFTYDDFGNVLTETDSAGLTKTYEYDASGKLSAVNLPAVPDPLDSDSDGNTTADVPRFEYGYDWSGNQTLIRDSLGRDTVFAFDAAGRQLTRTLPEGTVESTTYDERGQQKTHISFEGIVTEYVYDNGTTHLNEGDSGYAVGSGRMTEQRFYPSAAAYASGSGTPSEVWKTTYDALGRKIKFETVAGGSSTNRTEEWIYDDAGQVIQASSPEGIINYAYHPATAQKTRMWTTKATGIEPTNLADAVEDTHYSYNALGWLTEVKVIEKNDSPLAAGSEEVTSYGHDLFGRELRVDSPNGVIETRQVNLLGQVTRVRHYGPDDSPYDLGNNPVRSQFDYTLQNGQRTKLDETFYFDHDNDSNTPDVAKTTTYDWLYDANDRLLSETIDHHDNDLDRTEAFVMDLFGNRLSRTVDYAATSTLTDQAFAYIYDDNDRLINETLDEGADSSIDKTTTYSWDSTQQTAKQTFTGESTAPANLVSSQTFAYDLQGRLAEVINTPETGPATKVTYEYDSSSIRISSSQFTDANDNGTFESSELDHTLEYLVDHRNHTGYAQTIVETTKDSSGQVVKRIATTFGTDEITQTTTDYIAGVAQTPVVHTFGHDAHGSVRVLLDAAGAIAQAYTYAAYGQLLAIHNTTGALIGQPATPGLEVQALTSLLYSGESFDSRIGQQFLRARWYDPGAGRFSRLDPYFGNLNDPLSFNKYNYVHSNPIAGIDPTGLFSLGGTIGGIGIQAGIRGLKAGAVGAVAGSLLGGIDSALARDATWASIGRGAAMGGAVGFAGGFLFGTLFTAGPLLVAKGILTTDAWFITSALSQIFLSSTVLAGTGLGVGSSIRGGNYWQAAFRLATGGIGYARSLQAMALTAASHVPERQIQRLIQDSNRNFRMTRENALDGVIGPPGTYRVNVKGDSGQGADIEFYDINGKLLLNREVKSHTGGYTSFKNHLSHAGKNQVAGNGEVWIQRRAAETTPEEIQQWIRKFVMQPNRDLSNYRNVRVVVHDEHGNIFFNGGLNR